MRINAQIYVKNSLNHRWQRDRRSVPHHPLGWLAGRLICWSTRPFNRRLCLITCIQSFYFQVGWTSQVIHYPGSLWFYPFVLSWYTYGTFLSYHACCETLFLGTHLLFQNSLHLNHLSWIFFHDDKCVPYC